MSMNDFEFAVYNLHQDLGAAATWQQKDAAWDRFEERWLKAFKASDAGREIDRLLDLGKKLVSCELESRDESRRFKLWRKRQGYAVRAMRVARVRQFDTLFANACYGDAPELAAMWRAAAGLSWKSLLGLPG